MPDPKAYKDEKEWMAACVPKRIEEGDEQDQAVAVCMSMWRDKDKKSIDTAPILDDDTKSGRSWRLATQTGSSLRCVRFKKRSQMPGLPGRKKISGRHQPKTLTGENVLVSYGMGVKRLGGGRVGGYLVQFSTAADPDISEARDYFARRY